MTMSLDWQPFSSILKSFKSNPQSTKQMNKLFYDFRQINNHEYSFSGFVLQLIQKIIPQSNHRQMNNNRDHPTALKYAVLHPHPSLKQIRRSFERHCGFQLANLQQLAIRRYKMNTEWIQKFMQTCEWRHKQTAPVVHCLYLELLSPSAHSKSIQVEVYIEHIEVTIAHLKKLILHEALYLLIEAVKAYKVLLQKFKEVSVNSQTFGLNAKGVCVSWFNHHLQLDFCQEKKIRSQFGIVQAIINLVKEKSEPICQSFLVKIQDNLLHRRQSSHLKTISFEQMLTYFNSFAKGNHIRIPTNLKYLVNQQRLAKNLLEFKMESSAIFDNRSTFIADKENINGIPLKLSCKESVSGNLVYEKRTRSRISCYEKIGHNPRKTVEIGNNNNTSTLLSETGKYKNISLKSSKAQKTVSLQIGTLSKLQSFRTNKNGTSNSSNSNNANSHCRSHSNANVDFAHLDKNNIETTRSFEKSDLYKRYSEMKTNPTTAERSLLVQSKLSGQHLQITETDTVRKIRNKSAYDYIPCSIAQNLKEEQSKESSVKNNSGNPTKNWIPMPSNPLQSTDPTFHVIPDYQDEIIKTNQWTHTFRNLINNDNNVKMNTSITQGQDTSNYLLDVHLDKLDRLSKQMVISVIPKGSEKAFQTSCRCITEQQQL